ncbi:GNAT family N-acetyltransferase [uncultured Cohaesibacter sp.]|uniref:GNAT family N-acetyltransferase n=1 Tax=uncultured Cohaesibacter sp. TaxID=1002546 RepID=UPI00292F6B3E|nr:GNAT family N-acetyltransferase [uncultured Cohaesibacter sp.]
MAMSFCLRSATVRDMDALTELSRLSFAAGLVADYDPHILAEALPFVSQISESLVQSGQLYVAEGEKGRLVGAGGWSRDYHGLPPVPGVGHIRQFVVHPDHMRQGIGRVLFQRCLEEADDILQFDSQASLSAIAFYSSLGFESIKEDKVILPNGIEFPTCLMRFDRY